MTDRTYRTILGGLIIVCLYFELDWLMYGLIGLLLFEGVTDLRVPRVACMLEKLVNVDAPSYFNPDLVEQSRFIIESERVWRVVVGVLLFVSISFVELLWWLPWFMGFAIFGAGLSGVCPVLLAIRWVGFK